MKKFMIIVDATCDISEDMQKEFGIEAVPGFIHLPDNTDIPQFLSWKDNDREEFYNKLKKNPNAYATAPANPEMFAEAFKKYARLGYDMLVLTMSSAMSGTYDFAVKGREQALQECPDTKIHAIDTLRFGPGCGLMAVRAAQLRDMGKSLDEVTTWLEENKCRFHQAGWLD
ncbi:MAG: DegV family protein, partial [Ruminococcus sp.]|nr:DegV family protein [Ruminococcus sp.]